jgi:hypothetical protein
MKPAPAIDLAHRLLHRLGWSVGEAGFKLPNGSRYWRVDAPKESQDILNSRYQQSVTRTQRPIAVVAAER